MVDKVKVLKELVSRNKLLVSILVIGIIFFPTALWLRDNRIPMEHYYYPSCQDETISHRNFVKRKTSAWIQFVCWNNSKNYSRMAFYLNPEYDNWKGINEMLWEFPPAYIYDYYAFIESGFVGIIYFRLDGNEWEPIIRVGVIY